jgi:hypothetical protein
MSTMFEPVGGGIGVLPDPEYNNHVVTHHEADTSISFEYQYVCCGVSPYAATCL